jgi:cysteine-rich repeat protein
MRIAYVMAGMLAAAVLGCGDIEQDPRDPAMIDVSASEEALIGQPKDIPAPVVEAPDAAPAPEPDAAPAPDAECDAAPPDAAPPEPVCGNGMIEDGESCDDGNATGMDGCSATCQSEHLCCCGNGVIEPGEACDDGNQIDGDGCNWTCEVEGG